LAESFFTAVIVGSTMNEEAVLGKQTRQYEDHLQNQTGLKEKSGDYFYGTSRGMHMIFETGLGLFGAEGGDHGHGTETGLAYADQPTAQKVLSADMGIRAGYERHGGDNKLLTFQYNKRGQIQDIPNFSLMPAPPVRH
jgi:hypothetical protein